MSTLLERIIPIVGAQVLDALAQPTFGSITINDVDTQTGTKIDVESDQSAVKIGDNVVVKVYIQTGPNIAINQFRLVVDFDQSVLSVVDADSVTTGAQVTLTNPNFKVLNPEVDNIAFNGRIRLTASLEEGDIQLSSKTEVAQITFNAQSLGSTVVRIATGANATQLKTSAQRAIGFTVSEKQLNIVSEAVTPTPTVTPTPSTTTVVPTSTPPVYVPEGQIPATALGDDIAFLLPIVAGVILFATGIALTRGKNDTKGH